jgi:hypothetical protein
LQVDPYFFLWLNSEDMDDSQRPNSDDPFSGDAKIEDAEIVEDTTPATDSPDGSSSVSDSTPSDTMTNPGEFNYLQNLQTQINMNIANIDRLKEEMQPIKEMIASYLENDSEYMELTKKAKEAATEKGSRKKELMSQPNGRSMDEKLNKLKEEQNEANAMISQLLDEYRKTTGANEFEGPDGELRTIVMVAKLIRKTNLNRDN